MLTVAWLLTLLSWILLWAWLWPESVGKWVANFKRGYQRRMAEPLKREGTK